MYHFLILCLFILGGCNRQLDEKTLTSLTNGKIQQMSTSQLRAVAMQYKEAIITKDSEIQKTACALDANDVLSGVIKKLFCPERTFPLPISEENLELVSKFLACDRGRQLGTLISSSAELQIRLYSCGEELKKRGYDTNDLDIEQRNEPKYRQFFPPLKPEELPPEIGTKDSTYF